MVPLIQPLEVVEQYCSAYCEVLNAADLTRLKRYVSGLLVSSNKTVEGINKLFLLQQEDQSSLNRFLTASHFDAAALNRARVSWLQNCAQMAFKHGEKEKGVIVLDDTLLRHYGAHFERSAWLYDHVSRSYAYSHCLVNLHYSDDQTDYPLDYRLWEPADPASVEQALLAVGFEFKPEKRALQQQRAAEWQAYLLKTYHRKRKQVSGRAMQAVCRTKIDEARQLLMDFWAAYPEADLPVAFDTWYTCAELCNFIAHTLKRSYVGTLCNKDILLIGPEKQEVSCGEFVQRLLTQHRQAVQQGKPPLFEKVGIHYKGKKENYWTYCRTHRLKNLGLQRLVVSFSKEDCSDSEPKIYVSNRLHWRSGGILRIRRHRWPIEVYHEEAKAEGLDQYQVRQFDALKKHIACVCVAYSILKRVQFDPDLLNKLKWNPAQTTGSLAFWRRVMSANVLLEFVAWLIRDLPDKPPLDNIFHKLAQVYS